jgi:MULE transposase domain
MCCQWLERILFFHNESLQLLYLFLKSYVLDSTYKTNRFNLPLLNIVGFTATNRSFVIGQAFLTHEEEEDYVWVLYYEYNLPTPESITTDKAGGLHNACSTVWPDVPHLLCRWHIDKDVKAYCQKQWLIQTDHISNQERKSLIDRHVTKFTGFWSQLLYAQTDTTRHCRPSRIDTITRNLRLLNISAACGYHSRRHSF